MAARIEYKRLKSIARQFNLGFSRGSDEDGPFVQLSGFKKDLDDAVYNEELDTDYWVQKGTGGYFLQRRDTGGY